MQPRDGPLASEGRASAVTSETQHQGRSPALAASSRVAPQEKAGVLQQGRHR